MPSETDAEKLTASTSQEIVKLQLMIENIKLKENIRNYKVQEMNQKRKSTKKSKKTTRKIELISEEGTTYGYEFGERSTVQCFKT